jgi:hypothetical protein
MASEAHMRSRHCGPPPLSDAWLQHWTPATEWSRTKRAPKHAAWTYEREFARA